MKYLNIWICNTYKVTVEDLLEKLLQTSVSEPKNLRHVHEVHALKVSCQLSRDSTKV